MEDAKRKKDEWTQRLRNYEMDGLLSLRDALLARGFMLTMSSADIKKIIRDIRSTVSVIYDYRYFHGLVQICNSVKFYFGEEFGPTRKFTH